MKRAISLLLIGFLLLLIPGCYDYNDPDEIAWVLAIGLDKGKQNNLTITTVVAVPKNIAGGGGGQPASGGGGGGGFFTVSMEAPTFLSALELLDSVVDRRADLSHIKWVVFSRALAEEGLTKYMDTLVRFHQFRRTSYVIICEGGAEDFLSKGVPKLEDNVGKYYELLQRGWRYTEFIPFDNFEYFYIKSEMPGVAPLGILASLNREAPVYNNNSPKANGIYQAGKIPREGGGELEFMGAAIFKEGKMVGTLNGNQVGVQKIFEGTMKRTFIDVPDPEHRNDYIIVEVKPRQSPKVNVQIVDGYPHIAVDVQMEGGVVGIQSRENYITPARLYIIEDAVEKSLYRDINETMVKSMDLKADFLGFGLHAKKLFLTWPEWVAYNWDEKYPEATFDIKVDYKVRRAGLLHEIVPIQ
ncbi:Spore germination B3/ GerAC like, C-terminal [Desulfotomaculum arcticum]|uniref:Spore germination B3/ GerAC like, C-terminal n=1 Tax=Desulfotruncus arcticus DSM 17038 TaxID=1121424 RepID=A0A1I2UFD7_9FIRM|nr:Ger(x)C family spore germination protein [Desulfotruncus arcticus]SFG75892.1 Spore germination B3/ GerAC like, C-terminal [Desulfotomaculum arcticum] [Desulfotruncus arcticus DSM 17038]